MELRIGCHVKYRKRAEQPFGDLTGFVGRADADYSRQFATLVCNASDFSRFASKPSNAILPQVIGIPLTFAITSLLGIFVASASRTIYGEPLWDPLVGCASLLLSAEREC